MAIVEFSTEQMKGHVAATTIFPPLEAITIADYHEEPLVFHISSEDNKLYSTRVGDSGEFMLKDVAQQFGFNDRMCHTFHCTQDFDGNIFFGFVVMEGGATRVQLCRPFTAKDLDKDDLSYLLLRRTGGTMQEETEGKISRLQMGYHCIDSESDYVSVLCTFDTRGNGLTKQDLCRAIVDEDNWSFEMSRDCELPEDAGEIQGMAVTTTPFGDGTMCLYTLAGDQSKKPQLEWTSFEMVSGRPIRCKQGIPDDMNYARALTIWANEDGYTDVLVAGQGLWRYGCNNFSHHSKMPDKWTSAHDDVDDPEIEDMRLYQGEDKQTIWYSTPNLGLGYISKTTEQEFTDVKQVKLLPDGQLHSNRTYSPYLNPVSRRMEVMYTANDSTLKRMYMDSEHTMLWSTIPYYTPTRETKVAEFNSYFVHCAVTGADGAPVVNKKVRLCASGSINVRIKGKPVDVDPEGIDLETDYRGRVEFIASRDEYGTTQTFTVKDSPSGEEIFGGQLFPVYPDEMLFKRSEALRTKDGLMAAKTKDGKYLIPKNLKEYDDSVDQVAKAIDYLLTHREELKKSTESSGAAWVHKLPAEKQIVRRENLVCGHGLDTIARVGSQKNNIFEDAWDTFCGWVNDALNWVKKAIEHVVDWAIETVGDAVKFVLHWEGKILRWTIGKIPYLGPAICGIFDLVAGGIEAFWDLMEVGIHWDEITETHKSIKSFLDGSLTYCIDQVPQVQAKGDAWFNSIEQTIRGWGPVKDDTPADREATGAAGDKQKEIESDSKFNYAYHQLQYGGAGDSSTLGGQLPSDPSGMPFFDALVNVAGSVENSVEQVASDLQTLLTQKGTSVTVSDVFKQIGVDVLVGFVDIIKTIFDSGLQFAKGALEAMKKVLETEVDIPVFSWIWGLISGGSKFSLLDAIALILAIPVTFGYKLIYGANETVPDLTGYNFADLWSGAKNVGINIKVTLMLINLSSVTVIGLLGLIGDAIPDLAANKLEYYGPVPQRMKTKKGEERKQPLQRRPKTGLRLPQLAAARFRSPNPMAALSPAYAKVRFGKLGIIFGFFDNPYLRSALFTGIRAATIPKFVLEEHQDLQDLKLASWLTALVVDVTDVIIHFMLQEKLDDIGADKQAKHVIALIGFAVELVSSGIDITVAGIEAKREGFRVATVFDIIGALCFIEACGMDTVANLDPEEETKVAVEVAGKVFLGLAVGSSIAATVLAKLDDKWHIPANPRIF